VSAFILVLASFHLTSSNMPFTLGVYFEQLLKVTDNSVYIIDHRNSDNFIEEIRK